MQFLSRDQHCVLAATEIEQFKSLQRRDQLPTWAAGDADTRGYSPFESMLLIIANDLAEGPASSREAAATIASRGFGPIHQRWGEIDETSKSIVRGITPAVEILYGTLEIPINKTVGRRTAPLGKTEPIIFCNTLAEIAANFPSPLRLVAVNVSRIAAEMRVRAEQQQIDLTEFWSYRFPTLKDPGRRRTGADR